jgi:NAD(P)H-nitrite reductase large subunit
MTATKPLAEPRRGIYTKLIIRDRRLVGAILMGETSKTGLSDAGLRPRQQAAGGAGIAAVRPRRAAAEGHAGRNAARNPGVQLQRRDQSRHRQLRRRRQPHRNVGDEGDLLCTVDSEAKVLQYTGRFMQYYREHAKYKDRTYTFAERVGLERIRAVVLEDSDGIVAALDAVLEKSIADTFDPWTERAEPRTANQFGSVLAGEE